MITVSSSRASIRMDPDKPKVSIKHHRKNKPVPADTEAGVRLSGASLPRDTSRSTIWSPSRIMHTLPKGVQPIFAAILNCFRLNQLERDKLMKIITQGVHANVRLRDRDGLPIRWCYVPTLPTVSVTGTSLALHLCSSDHFFRVSLFDFDGQINKPSSIKPLDNRIFTLPKSIRRTTMETFCDYVTALMKGFIEENKLLSKATCNSVQLGVIAGFDVKIKPQMKPASAVVIGCSKDYRMYNFLENDFVSYFHAAFKKAGLNIEIGTVMNDTVAVLLSGIYQTSSQLNKTEEGQADCSISVICNRGGSNLAYLETDKEFLDSFLIDERHPLRRPMGSGHCAVMNSEAGYYIGAKGELNVVANSLEKEICDTINSPLRLEYVISGAWYPQLLKQAIRLLVVTKSVDLQLDSNWNIEDSKCFEVFTMCNRWHASTAQILDTNMASELQMLLGVKHLNSICAGVIAETCNAIVCRTAEFTAISIMSIANHLYNRTFPKQMVVAYGGTLFTAVSQLKEYLESALSTMVPSSTEIILLNADEALGSAVTALSRTEQQ